MLLISRIVRIVTRPLVKRVLVTVVSIVLVLCLYSEITQALGDSYSRSYNNGVCTKCGSALKLINTSVDEGQVIYIYKCTNRTCNHRVTLPEYWHDHLI